MMIDDATSKKNGDLSNENGASWDLNGMWLGIICWESHQQYGDMDLYGWITMTSRCDETGRMYGESYLNVHISALIRSVFFW